MRKAVRLPVQLLCGALALICSLRSPVSAEKLVIAQFGQEKFLLYLPLYIAMEEGLFAKRGIEVTLKFAGNDDQIFAAVMSGDAQIGVGDPIFAAIARERGFPGKVIAEMVKRLGLTGVAKDQSIPKIEQPSALKGYTICSLPAPSTTFTLLSEILRVNKLENTKVVQVAIGGQVPALAAKQCDIALDLEPGVTLAESKGMKAVFSFDRFTVPMTITGWQTTEKVIASHGPILEKAVSALQEALILLSKDPEAALRTSRKIFPQLSEAVVRQAVDRMNSLDVYPKTAVIEDSSWQRTVKVRLDSGELKTPQKTEVTVENRFAEAARKEFSLPAEE